MTALQRRQPHQVPTSLKTPCSVPVDNAGTGNGSISAGNEIKKNLCYKHVYTPKGPNANKTNNHWLPFCNESQHTPVKKRGPLPRRGRWEGRWEKENALLYEAWWRKATSIDTWETGSASMDGPGSALQKTRGRQGITRQAPMKIYITARIQFLNTWRFIFCYNILYLYCKDLIMDNLSAFSLFLNTWQLCRWMYGENRDAIWGRWRAPFPS